MMLNRNHKLSNENERLYLSGEGQSGKRSISQSTGKEIYTERGDRYRPLPDIIKIDVEGHEVQALEGMPNALEHARWIMVEVHDDSDVVEVQSLLSNAFDCNEFLRITERRNEVFVFAHH